MPVGRRHPERDLRAGRAAGPGPRRTPDPVPLPLHRVRRRLHRLVAERVDPPQRQRRGEDRRRAGVAHAAGQARSRARADLAPARVQQLPEPAGGTDDDRRVDAAGHHPAQHDPDLARAGPVARRGSHAAAPLPLAASLGQHRGGVLQARRPAGGRGRAARLGGGVHRRDHPQQHHRAPGTGQVPRLLPAPAASRPGMPDHLLGRDLGPGRRRDRGATARALRVRAVRRSRAPPGLDRVHALAPEPVGPPPAAARLARRAAGEPRGRFPRGGRRRRGGGGRSRGCWPPSCSAAWPTP